MPSLSDMQAAQWVIIVSAALAAIVTLAILAAASRAFTDRQNLVDTKGFSNFRAADPSRLCVNPPGDETLPIKRCTTLQWRCHINCTSTHDNTTVTRKLFWDWPDFEADFGGYYGDLFFLLTSLNAPPCNLIQSASTSLSNQDLRWTTESTSDKKHEDYAVIVDDPVYLREIFSVFSENFPWPFEATGNQAIYQRYHPGVAPNWRAGDDVDTPDQVDGYDRTAPGTLQFYFEYNGNSSRKNRVDVSGKTLPDFIRLNLRSGVAFDNAHKRCPTAMPFGGQPYLVDNFTTINCNGPPVVCPKGHESNVTTMQSCSRNNFNCCVSDILPTIPLDVADCGLLELIAVDVCSAELDACAGNNVSVPDTTVLDAYVQAARSDRTLKTNSIFDAMTYDDLYGMYTGLIASAVTAAVTAMASVVGLLLLYLLRR